MAAEIDRRSIWLLLIVKGRRILFFLALLSFLWYIVSIPVPEGLTPAGRNAIAIFFLCLILWVSNVIPLAITSLFAIVLVPLLDVLPRKEVYGLFGNEAVFFILGAFILGGAVMHSGLSNRIALFIMGRFGASPKRLLLSVYLLSAVLSFFMSEHAVAAMLFPIVLDITKSLGLKPGTSGYGKLLFFSLSWGCVIGGVATFLGGARVPLAAGMLREITGKTIDFVSYSVAVLPLVAVMLLVGYLILTRAFPMDVESVEKVHEFLEKRIRAIGKVSYTEYAVGLVLLLTVIAWAAIGKITGLSTIALTSVVVLFILRLVRWKDIEQYVNWGVILMYGGAIIMGTALEKSGAASWMAERAFGQWVVNPWTAIAFFSLFALLLTEGMSNAAVIAILLPVGVGLTQRFSMDPRIVTYAIAIPAGLAFALPISTPANAIAISSNYVTVKDMAKLGAVMTVVSWIVFNLVARFYWPLVGLGY